MPLRLRKPKPFGVFLCFIRTDASVVWGTEGFATGGRRTCAMGYDEPRPRELSVPAGTLSVPAESDHHALVDAGHGQVVLEEGGKEEWST